MEVIEFVENLIKLSKNGGLCHSEKQVNKLKDKIKYLKSKQFIDDPHYLAMTEQRLLGIALSAQKIDIYNDSRITHRCEDFESLRPNGQMVVGVDIEEVKEYITKSGDNEGKKRANIIISDSTAKLKVVVWSTEYEKYSSLLIPGNCVILKGEKGYGRYVDSFICREVWQP